ncbi:hypothetical protein CI238_02270 [Colletotrichum incanum]|uniref:Uncharacterized protein n=1 Tax=Colletotrichum incanum TaxID=1573173 RepID=A0A166ZHN3_COLIC|nr:hypothetical protein CI238_02270 [Colletotrichum incanum]
MAESGGGRDRSTRSLSISVGLTNSRANPPSALTSGKSFSRPRGSSSCRLNGTTAGNYRTSSGCNSATLAVFSSLGVSHLGHCLFVSHYSRLLASHHLDRQHSGRTFLDDTRGETGGCLPPCATPREEHI